MLRSTPAIACFTAALALVPGCGGGSSSKRTAPPAGSLSFPRDGAMTDQTTVTVRGQATAGARIASVEVNGVGATSGDGFANFQATVPVSVGVATYDLDVQDARGRHFLRSNAGSTLVVPRILGAIEGVGADNAGARTLVLDAATLEVVAIADGTGARSVVSDLDSGVTPPAIAPRAIGVDTTRNVGVVLDSGLPGLVAVDLASGAHDILSDATHGTGAPFLAATALAIDVKDDVAFVLDPVAAAIDSVALATGDRTPISSGAIGTGPSLANASDLAVDVSGLRVFVTDPVANAVLAIDVATGNRTILSDGTTGSGPALDTPVAVAFDATRTHLVVANAPTGKSIALLVVNVADGTRTLLSSASFGSGQLFCSVRGLAYDAGGDRLLLADTVLGGVLAIDPVSGDRTLSGRASLGSGPILALSTGAVFGAGNASILTIGDAVAPGTADVALIDLATRNRAFLSDPGAGGTSIFQSPRGLALARDGSAVYVVDATLRAVVRVDRANGVHTILSDDTHGTGGSFVLPTAIGTLANGTSAVVAEDFGVGTGALISVDLATGDRSILSDATRGSGPLLTDGLVALAVDDSLGHALVLASNPPALFSIDLATGDRTLAASDTHGIGPSLAGTLSVANGIEPGTAFLGAASGDGAVLLVDLASGDRGTASGGTGGALRGNGPRCKVPAGLVADPATRTLYVVDSAGGSLFQIDADTGERVILSR